MLIFRTDASIETGFKHLIRSAYLASLLKKKSDILFCVNKDRVVSRFLEERRIPYCLLKELKRLQKDSTGIKGIVFDLRAFSPADMEFLQRAAANHIYTVQVTDLGLIQQPVDVTIAAQSSLEKTLPLPKTGMSTASLTRAI